MKQNIAWMILWTDMLRLAISLIVLLVLVLFRPLTTVINEEITNYANWDEPSLKVLAYLAEWRASEGGNDFSMLNLLEVKMGTYLDGSAKAPNHISCSRNTNRCHHCISNPIRWPCPPATFTGTVLSFTVSFAKQVEGTHQMVTRRI